MNLLINVLLEALLDTAKMLPFLFGAYLLMEYLERRPMGHLEEQLASSRLSPVIGGVAGILPQCGFSAAAANLYNRGMITMGTLMAVFVSTSDEALPMLLASPDHYSLLLWLVGIKLVLGIGCGLLLDLLWRHPSGHHHHQPDEPCEECNHYHHSIFEAALRHTASIAVFIFAVTVALGGAIALAGEENIARWLMTGSVWQPLAAGLVGFIPNCASSVILTRLLIDGSVSLGSAVAGLTTGAGVGLLVLVRGARNKKNLAIFLALLYAVGVVAGVCINLLL